MILSSVIPGARLRQRFDELLNTAATLETGVNFASWEDLKDFDPYDPTHFFTMRLQAWDLRFERYAWKV
jgi:hypothetical protein